MFPGESSSTSPDSYNSSSFNSSAGTTTPTISAEHAGFFKHPLFHRHCPQEHASFCSAYSRDMAARNSDRTSNLSPRRQSIQAAISAGYLSREDAQLLIMQDPGSYATHALQLQAGFSLNNMQAQFYNEQMLHSLSGSHFTGIERTENQELLMNSMQSSSRSNEVLQSLNMENIGRPIPSAQAAPVRYEEACTPRPRWSPTPEQIEILEALFNSGTRTPSRDMITDIAAQLRNYGTIAEANVFYWFQNRKARAKRKQLQPASRSSSCH